MALESLIGDIYKSNQQLPLSYGQLYNSQFSPYYAFLAQQQQSLGQNQGDVGQQGLQGATSLGNSGLNLYGQLAGMQQQQQQFNALTPVLGSLLNQFGGGFNLPSIGQIGDPMAGFGGAMGGAYGQLGNFQNRAYNENVNASNAFGGQFSDMFNRQANMMPGRPGNVPTQGPGVFDDPNNFNYSAPQTGGGMPYPGTPQTGGGFPQPPQTGGGMQYPGMPNYAAPAGGGGQYGGGLNPGPGMPGTSTNGIPAQSAPASPSIDGGVNPVEWEMNRLRSQYTGGKAPQPMYQTSQNPRGGYTQTPYSPNLQQQEEARRNLGRQFQQEQALSQYAPKPPQQQGWDPQNIEYQRTGSRSSWSAPGVPNSVEYDYSPIIPATFKGPPPKNFPGAVKVRSL